MLIIFIRAYGSPRDGAKMKLKLLILPFAFGAFLIATISHSAEPTELMSDQLPGYANVKSANFGEIPEHSLMWAFFTRVIALENGKAMAGLELIADVGLPKSGAANLFKHIRASVDQVRQDAVLEVRNTCERRSEFSSRRDIADRFAEVDRTLNSRREALVAEVLQLVGSDAHRKITAWVSENIGPSYSEVSFDYSMYFEESGSDPHDVLTKLCKGNS